MIFGSTPAQRVPFQRPPQASFYTPRVPQSAFYSHFQPFATFNRLAALPAYVNAESRADMQPGVSRLERRPAGVRQAMPTVVAPPVATPMLPAGPGPGPANEPTVNGFGGGFGHTPFGSAGEGGSPYSAAGSPYRIMRSGMFPGVRTNVSDPRYGVYNAARQIRAMTPYAYPNANVPAGNYAAGGPVGA